jgi:hypothetical protein
LTYCSKRLPEDNIDNGESKTKNDFDAANDKGLLTKIHTYSSSGSKLPPVTDELIKNQTEAHSKSRKLSAHLLCRSLCPTSSTGSNGASSNDNANTMMSPKAASAADMMRLPIGVAKERVGGKRKALKIVLLGPPTTICVLILLYMCPHTTIASSYSYICVLMLLYVSSYCHILILLYMCPHTNTATCPHPAICVLILEYVSSVEDGVWPEYTLHQAGTWAAHRKFLALEQRHAQARPCLTVTIHKTEVRQHTSAYVSIRQHTSAYVSIRQHTSTACYTVTIHTTEVRGPSYADVCCRKLS